MIDEHTLVVAISQSGETIDTIAAMKEARAHGSHVLADDEHHGQPDDPRVRLGALHPGRARDRRRRIQDLHRAGHADVPAGAEAGHGAGHDRTRPGRDAAGAGALAARPGRSRRWTRGDLVEPIAERFWQNEFFLYLGRYIGLPIALEGALKLKEISYIPTDAYAAGEMKHGPIALLDDTTPVVVVATDNHVYHKVVSNVEEVRARGAHVIAIATDGNTEIERVAEHVIYLPRTEPELQAVLAILPLQQLAYAIARRRGLDIDKPRNLAKTVTVE